jgi:hypothetical protein
VTDPLSCVWVNGLHHLNMTWNVDACTKLKAQRLMNSLIVTIAVYKLCRLYIATVPNGIVMDRCRSAYSRFCEASIVATESWQYGSTKIGLFSLAKISWLCLAMHTLNIVKFNMNWNSFPQENTIRQDKFYAKRMCERQGIIHTQRKVWYSHHFSK